MDTATLERLQQALANRRAADGISGEYSHHKRDDVARYGQHLLDQRRGASKPAPVAVAPATRFIAPQPTPTIEPAPVSAETVDLDGSLAAAVERERLSVPFRTWLLLRQLDDSGNGRISADIARHELSKGRYAYAKRNTINRHLRLCERVGFLHFSANRKYIHYRSRSRMYRLLGQERSSGWHVEIPVSSLLGSFVDFRALCHASFIAGKGDDGAQISRDAIKSETGRSRPTQIKYDALAGISRRVNLEVIGTIQNKHDWTEAKYELSLDNRLRIQQVKTVDGKKHILCRQMPNSYQSPYKTVKSGRRWLNQRIKHLRNSRFAGSFDSDIQPQRRYFETYSQTTGAEIAYVASDNYGKIDNGRLWLAV